MSDKPNPCAEVDLSLPPYSDPYTRMAARVFNIHYDEVDRVMRQYTKQQYWMYMYMAEGPTVLAHIFHENILGPNWDPNPKSTTH